MQKAAILWLFSSVLVQERCLALVLRAYETTMGLLQGVSGSPDSELFCAGIDAVMNLLLQGCLKFTDPGFDAAVQRFVQFLQTLWGVSGQCMAALAYLSNFVSIQGMGAVDRYMSLLDKIRDEIVPGFIVGVSDKLKGRRYQVPVEIERRHSDYMWTIPDAAGVQDAVKVFLVQKGSSFQAHTDGVARVVERLAIIGLAKFVRDLLPAFLEVARDNELFCQGLLEGCRRFLQNVVYFRAYQRVENDLQIIRSIRVSIASIASDVLDKKLSDAGKPKSVTVPESLTLELLQVCDEDRAPYLEYLSGNLPDNSRGCPMAPQDKPVGDVLETWGALAGVSLETVFPVAVAANATEAAVGTPAIVMTILHLSLYIEPDDAFLALLCRAVFSPWPAAVALVVRVLQALVHRNSANVEPIVHHVRRALTATRIDELCIPQTVVALQRVLESARLEGVVLCHEALVEISAVAIVAFTAGSPVARRHALELWPWVSAYRDFFERCGDDLAFHAQRRVLQSVATVTEAELRGLTSLNFATVACANNPRLLLFYLGSFGKFLLREAVLEEQKHVLRTASRFLVKILVRSEAALENALALLVAITEDPDEFTGELIGSIARRAVSARPAVELIGLFGAMSPALIPRVFTAFASTNQDNARCAVATAVELELKSASPPIYAALHAAMLALSRHLSMRVFASAGLVQGDVAILAGDLAQVLAGIDLRDFQADKWLILLVNITLVLPESAASKALRKWFELRQFNHTSTLFEQLLAVLAPLTRADPDLARVIFELDVPAMVDTFCYEAMSSWPIFSGIVACLTVDRQRLPHFEDAIPLFFSRAGTLLAIGLWHMLDKNQEIRGRSLEFLRSLAILVGTGRSDQAWAAKVLARLDEIRQPVLHSFTIWIQRDFESFSDWLNETFQFCGSAFSRAVSAILKGAPKLIANAKKDQGAMPRVVSCTTRDRRSNSVYGAKLPQLGPKKRKASVLGIELPTLIGEGEAVVVRIDPPRANRVDVLAGVLRTVTIPDLLAICDVCGLTSPLARLIDTHTHNHVETFIIRVLASEMPDAARVNSALQCLLYVFHRETAGFIAVVRAHLSAECWFYDNVRARDARAVDRMNFVLQLLGNCRIENAKAYEELRAEVVPFCAMHGHTYDAAAALLGDATGLKARRRMTQLTGQEEVWPLEQLLRDLPVPPAFLLSWGLHCGDLRTAARALEMFDHLKYVLPGPEVETALHALSEVAAMLNERTDPAQASRFRAASLRIGAVGLDNEPPIALGVAYLGRCLTVLKRFVSEATRPPEALFMTALAFLECKALEYNNLFLLALQIAQIFATRHGVPEAGLLRRMLSITCDEADALGAIFDIVNALLPTLDQQSAGLAVVALVPSLWCRIEEPRVATEMGTKIATALGRPEAAERVAAVALMRDHRSGLIRELIGPILATMADDDAMILAKFVIRVAKTGTVAQREAAFAVCDEILKKNGTREDPVWRHLAHSAVSDSKLWGNRIVKNLLTTLCSLVVDPAEFPALTPRTFYSAFPRIEIPLAPARPPGVPFVLNHAGWEGSAVLERQLARAAQVPAMEPFDTWRRLATAEELDTDQLYPAFDRGGRVVSQQPLGRPPAGRGGPIPTAKSTGSPGGARPPLPVPVSGVASGSGGRGPPMSPASLQRQAALPIAPKSPAAGLPTGVVASGSLTSSLGGSPGGLPGSRSVPTNLGGAGGPASRPPS
jgi:hypothetical protein